MIVLSIMVALMFAAAAITDLRSFTIPNWTSAGIIMAYGARFIIAGETTHPLGDAGLALAALVLGFGLYSMRWFGAGDVKLITAGVLWAGHDFALEFLTATAVLGAVVGLAVLALRSLDTLLPILPGIHRLIPRVNLVPYGLAIASAGLLTISLQAGLIKAGPIATGLQRSSWGLF